MLTLQRQGLKGSIVKQTFINSHPAFSPCTLRITGNLYVKNEHLIALANPLAGRYTAVQVIFSSVIIMLR
ncbi:hypothetical protein A4H97_27100 [Niastella yeongjuensis]|uniref:Uncharacterized protein n=1 Tax=Niastella yeongjuensis TaxID=354355 RepID=A0A1V9EYQ8_9BACT|nr:hypothetical protein A4H97_27100 [Niastella yeongjuensis]